MVETSEPLTVFVPGIMGSSLIYRGEGVSGELIEQEVWGEDPRLIVDSLVSNSRRLTSPNLEAGKIIEYLRFPVKKALYGPLLSFMESPAGLNLVRGETLLAFPYDWRLDNQVTADNLREKIAEFDPFGTRRLRFVGHSMGSLVIRILLSLEHDICDRTDAFFQIASPIEGSSKAFFSLSRKPRFHLLLDAILTIRAQAARDLLDALREFDSIYQLLPAENKLILYDCNGGQFSAVDLEVWLPAYHPKVELAKRVHAIIADTPAVNTFSLYTDAKPTDFYYLVDQLKRIVGCEAKTFVGGDGTVVCSSAFARTDICNRRLVKSTDHDAICGTSEVFEVLRSELL